ncbi:MAG: xanthine dehydrogenase family protein molybdopterin-binding subunit [Burkholderiales bacterium]
MPKITRRVLLQSTAAIGLAKATRAAERTAAPTGPPLAEARKTYIGAPTSRIDGPAKVTGAAKYAAEFGAPDLSFGFVIDSPITKGRIARIDSSAALQVPGVLEVLTHENRPPLADNDKAWKDDVAPEKGSPYRVLYDDKIRFNRQPLALVLAEDWDTARFAASLVAIDYPEEQNVTDLEAQQTNAFKVEKEEKARGDARKAFATSPVRHEAEYVIPTEHHNPMELYASTVVWEGNGKLTVYDKTQGVQNVQRYLCSVLEKNSDDVRVLGHFMGGGFGSGLRPQHQVVLAALGALKLKRSVRVVFTRQQMYALGHRPFTIERLALGANADGSLNSLSHEAIAETSQFEEFSRNDTGWGNLLYTSPNADFGHKLVRLDVPTPSDMRAPGAATGVYALESAMDELAVALKMDPVELRLKCYSDRDQNRDVPYTSKQLRACYEQGAAAFGWNKRNPEPRSMRDGSELVGWGVATGVWEALQMPAAVRIALAADGHAEISCATSDIGTGTYTIMAQVAADALGLPIENISIKLGDSTLPQSPVEGGSWIAASVCNAIVNTAGDVREELLRLAQKIPDSLLSSAGTDEVALVGGSIVSIMEPTRKVPIADAMRAGNVDRVEKEKTNTFEKRKTHAQNVHSAIFAEVKVDEQLGIVRVTRVVNAVAAGRILNAKTAHSQIMGSVVWGIGMALHEETLYDHRFGRIMNANIAEYHVPVNADVHDIKVIFVEELDPIINRLGVKGLGEIGIVGVAAAIANAVYHATGKRIRDLPITLDKIAA